MGRDLSRPDPAYGQRWAMRQRPVRAQALAHEVPTTRSAPHVYTDDLMRFLPLGGRALPTPSVIAEREFFDHHGPRPDRAFGRLVHAVLHQALLERQTDTLTQRLLLQLGEMNDGALKNDLERQLIEQELRRAGRILDAQFATEGHNFGADSAAWRTRASEYLGRYITTDDYLFANVWQYPLAGENGKTKPVPMLEFAFRVQTKRGVNLVGRFDRVDNRNGKPVVIDYKTGPPRSLIALRHDHQMLLYAAAIADLTGARSVMCEIHWLATGTKSTLHFSGAELRRAREEAARYTKQMERAAMFGAPLPAAHSAPPLRPGAVAPQPEAPVVS